MKTILTRGQMVIDIVTLLPLPRILSGVLKPESCNLLYFIKVLRMTSGFNLFNHQTFSAKMKEFQKKRVRAKLKKVTLEEFEERNEDIARISEIVLASKIIRLIAQVLILLCLSYFSGMFWFIVSYLQVLLRDERSTN